MDTLGDMLIRIKNAGIAGHESVVIPYSHFKNAVLERMLQEGYVAFVNKKTRKGFKVLEVGVAYNEDGAPKINNLQRVSKLSRRSYVGVHNIKPVRQGYGRLFVSTPQGIMTGEQAVQEKTGGEALFKVW